MILAKLFIILTKNAQEHPPSTSIINVNIYNENLKQELSYKIPTPEKSTNKVNKSQTKLTIILICLFLN